MSEEDSVNYLCDKLFALSLSEPQLVKENDFVIQILKAFGEHKFREYFDDLKYSGNKQPYIIYSVDQYSPQYIMASTKFFAYGPKVATRIGNYWKNTKMSITKIEKVLNPFLTAQFELKKEMKKKIYHRRCNTEYLFHGTEEDNIKGICQNNFNWRLRGTNVGHKFGQGVSFSPKAGYASDYPRSFCTGLEKCMILAQIVYSSKIIGDRDMVIPPENYDTSTRENGMVVVKYEDADYNPEYVIHYTK